MIWAGIEPYDMLAGLMRSVGDDLKKIGYEPDRQNLVPHLTLGRVRLLKDKDLFSRAIDQYRNIRSADMKISGIILYESILKREGPTYIPLHAFNLTA